MDMEPERIDPVSGNEIPLGAVAENVRDDIPAQLSEGEYVVPADVVNYYGVKFFEDLRNEAKEGFQEMAETGRIGGEPMDAPMNDAFPFDVSELQTEGDEVSGYNEGGFSLPARDYTRSAPTATVAPTRIGDIAAQAESKAAGTSSGRRGPIVTRRLYRNPITGQEIYLDGVNQGSGLKLGQIEDYLSTPRDERTPMQTTVTHQPVDAMGRPVAVPAGFEIVPIGEETGALKFGTGEDQISLSHPLAGTPFGPQINRNPQSNPFRAGYDQAIVRQDEMSKYPSFGGRADYFDQVQNLSSLSNQELFDAIDQRHGLGEFEGQATRKQAGMRTGLASGGETNRQLDELYRRQAEARAAGDYQLLGTLIDKQLEYEQYLVESGLDLDGNGRADTFGERTLGKLLGFGTDEQSAENRQQIIDRAENADVALRNYMLTDEQKEAEIARAADRQLRDFASYQDTPVGVSFDADAYLNDPGLGGQTGPGPSFSAPASPTPAPSAGLNMPAYTPPSAMGIPTPADPLAVPASTTRPDLLSTFVPPANAQTVPLSTPLSNAQIESSLPSGLSAAEIREINALDRRLSTPPRSSTPLQDRAAETGFTTALRTSPQQGNPFMQRRMMNEGGMVQGYQQGGIAYSSPQMRMEDGVPVADSSIRSQVQAALAKRRKGLEGPSVAEQAEQLRQERRAMTASERAAGRRQAIGNFFAPAFQAVGAVPDAIGSGLSRITGTPTPMQDLSATAREGLGVVGNTARAGLNMAGEGLDMLRSAPEAAIDMATDASRFLAAAPGNYANRVSGREASDAYQTGYEDGFAAGQRAAMAGIAKGDANTMLREARSQASAISAEQQAQGARDAASFDGAFFRYDDQLANQEAGTANMAALERQRAREAEVRRQAMARAASSQQLGFQQRSQDAARYAERARVRAEEEERQRQEQARLAELQAEREAQMEAERVMRQRFAANRAQDRFETNAQLAALYEGNNRLAARMEALLDESDDLERQQERLVNQYQSSAQGE